MTVRGTYGMLVSSVSVKAHFGMVKCMPQLPAKEASRLSSSASLQRQHIILMSSAAYNEISRVYILSKQVNNVLLHFLAWNCNAVLMTEDMHKQEPCCA